MVCAGEHRLVNTPEQYTQHTQQPEHDATPTARNQPNPKTSYESSPEVQRWLREQALEEHAVKPPFTPTFLAHQRDRPWVLSSLAHFYEDDLITDVVSVVSSGKEATVYCCAAHPATGYEWLAAKVYRPRMFRSLRNDAVYREGRAHYDETGKEMNRTRYRRSATKSDRGRATQVTSWIAYEYQTQRLLYDAGADVPRPLAQTGNAVLMEYVGDVGEPAPLLRNVDLGREEAQMLFERVLRNVELFLACDRIHGDLSAYNILYWRDGATIIDFAQAVDPRYSQMVYTLLARDVQRVCEHFAGYGIEADAVFLALDLWERYMRGEL